MLAEFYVLSGCQRVLYDIRLDFAFLAARCGIPILSSLSPSSNHVPSRFTHDPSLVGIRGTRFAFAMRWKAEDSIMRFQQSCSCTVGAFHKLDATLQKTLWFDQEHPRKRAFECLRVRNPVSYRIDAIPGGCKRFWLEAYRESIVIRQKVFVRET